MNIFVSYTTIDHNVTLFKLKEISAKLKKIGSVYIDIIDNNSQDKQKRVFDELDNSNIVVLVISDNIYNSKWVKIEIERAHNMSIPIIPFDIEEIMHLDISIISNKIFSVSSSAYKLIDV